MPQQTVFIVQHFDWKLKNLVGRRSIAYRTADEAVTRVEQDAEMFAGVVAYEVLLETDTGAEVVSPRVLARFGTVGPNFAV